MKTSIKIAQLLILSFAVTLTISSQPTDNVVTYYPFNGNANDVTGNEKNASVTGASLVPDRLNKVNAAYSFNGSSNYIRMPNVLLSGSNAFSLVAG
jgi:trimeric autotransporter adhesin